MMSSNHLANKEEKRQFQLENNTFGEHIPIRVAIISDRVYPYFKGGAEKRYWEISKNLVKLHCQVTFITGQWPGMAKEECNEGIKMLGAYKVGQFYVKGRKSILETSKYTLSLIKYLLFEEYDLIECEQFPILPIFPCKIISILRKKPFVLTWHEVWGRKLWKNYLGFWGIFGAFLESISVHLADKVISVSEHTTEKLITLCHVDPGNVFTVPNGLDLRWDRRNRTSNDGKSIQIERRRPIEPSDVIFVGRLHNHKHIDCLLRVIAVLKTSLPDIRCLIVGDGPEREGLQEIAETLNIKRNVTFTGFIENERLVYSMMRASRVFVLPSTREGFGITVIEANSCGLPVIVVKNSDNAACDLIKNGQNGFICKMDENEIAEKIRYILDAPHSAYSEVCKKISYEYGWEEISHNVLKVYSDLIEKKENKPLVVET